MGFYMVNLANFVNISYKKDKILSVIPPWKDAREAGE